MPRYLMFVEETRTVVRMKEFDAEDMEEAIGMVESDEWTEANGWEESDSSGNAEIREGLCYELK
jgi:hypothetical protein